MRLRAGFIAGLFLAQLLVSCKPESRELLESEDALDLRYGSNDYNKMDVYLPDKRNGNTRVIILLHGGYWYSGDKSDLTQYAKYYRDHGFACVTINYRLTRTADNYISPAQINDVGKAIDFLALRADEYHISPSKFGLLGVSSGAHLALLYTYAANTNGKVKTVVSLAGPTDLTKVQTLSGTILQSLISLIGSTPSANPGAYIEASPISHVDINSKPTLLVHGKTDNIVPAQQSIDLKAKLDEFNVENDLELIDGVGHDLSSPAVVNTILEDTELWFEDMIR